jgi:hypothetical protein
MRHFERVIEERHGFAGARRTSGGLGDPSRPPIQSIECHGFAGARRTSGGLGGPVEAPHVMA